MFDRVLVVLLLFCGLQNVITLNEGDECRLHETEGTCRLLKKCPIAQTELRKGNFPQICGFVDNDVVVCCTGGTDPGSTNETVTITTTIMSTTTTKTVPRSTEGDSCKTPKGIEGICKLRTDCSTVTEVDGRLVFVCGYADSHPIICCTNEAPPSRKRKPITLAPTGSIAKKKCEDYARYAFVRKNSPVSKNNPVCSFESEKLVSGGSILAKKNEFPHVVQIGYGPRNAIVWACVGTILSEYYVLTAAYCLALRSEGEARYVRAGVTNLLETKFQQRTIIERIAYPLYKPFKWYHDIGLLKVNIAFEMTTRVRPACLHTDKHLPQTNFRVAGWGKETLFGDVSNDMQKATLDVWSNEKCNGSYAIKVGINSKLHAGIAEEFMFCAAGAEGRSPCVVEPGGPLQYYLNVLGNKCIYTTIGVVSFGKACDMSNTPTIYTRVSAYLKWIEDLVWR